MCRNGQAQQGEAMWSSLSATEWPQQRRQKPEGPQPMWIGAAWLMSGRARRCAGLGRVPWSGELLPRAPTLLLPPKRGRPGSRTRSGTVTRRNCHSDVRSRGRRAASGRHTPCARRRVRGEGLMRWLASSSSSLARPLVCSRAQRTARRTSTAQSRAGEPKYTEIERGRRGTDTQK